MDSRTEVIRCGASPEPKNAAEGDCMYAHRRSTLIVLTFGLMFSGWTLAAADEQLPKGEEIMDKFVEATGGKAAYQKVHSEIWKGTFELVGKGVKGAATSYRAEPNKTYTIIELEGVGTIEDGTDGQTSWTRSAMQGPRIKQGDERAASLREAAFNGAVNWRNLYKQAESTGVENVSDQACYKVVLTPNEGKPETRYFDKKTNLMVKMTTLLPSPMGEVPVEIAISDYKPQNGLISPHKIDQKALGQEFLITIENIQYNPDIPKDRFDVPADVKSLAEKPAPAAK